MPEKAAPESASVMDRRAFLKAGVGSACAMGLAGVGCTQRRTETPASQTAQKGLVRPTPSRWFTELDDGRVRCELCPKRCELAEGERAPCRVRVNLAGVGYTLAHGNPALIQEDPVERIPLFHVLPGSRALSIATAGCNLHCRFCEAWDMTQVAPEEVYAYDMPPDELVAHAHAANVRSISYSFGEPVVFYEYMVEVGTLAGDAGLLNLIHTAGYVQPEPLREFAGRLDAANVDLKSFDPEFHREVVGGELAPVLATLQILRDAGVHIEITNIVIPTLNDDMTQISRMCKWVVSELGAGVPVHFARFYPLYRLSDLPRTPVSTLDHARETALEAGLRYVYVGRVTGHTGENTFCPSCGEPVIERVGFVIGGIHLTDGRCDYCGTPIPGTWA